MFIRDDLLNKIKEIYEIEEFTYVGIKRSNYNYSGASDSLLLFDTDNYSMAIRKSYLRKNVYHIELVEKNEKDGYCYLCNSKNYILEIKDNETILTKIYTIGNIEYHFPGKAFDFTQEFVIAALESN